MLGATVIQPSHAIRNGRILWHEPARGFPSWANRRLSHCARTRRSRGRRSRGRRGLLRSWCGRGRRGGLVTHLRVRRYRARFGVDKGFDRGWWHGKPPPLKLELEIRDVRVPLETLRLEVRSVKLCAQLLVRHIRKARRLIDKLRRTRPRGGYRRRIGRRSARTSSIRRRRRVDRCALLVFLDQPLPGLLLSLHLLLAPHDIGTMPRIPAQRQCADCRAVGGVRVFLLRTLVRKG